MTDLIGMGQAARKACRELANLSAPAKNRLLQAIAEQLDAQAPEILAANQVDMQAAKQKGLADAMLDRLLLDSQRLQGIISDIQQVISLPDPVGVELDSQRLDNGLRLLKRRIPLGVLGVIYEARPNVTVDISVLALKTGNAAILRGGRETLNTNQALLKAIQAALSECQLDSNTIQLIQDPDRALVGQLLTMDEYVDMIIPRGGPKLQAVCREQASVPVITGGIGICHMLLDKRADLTKATELVINAKVQRPTVCNALDTLLVHQDCDTDAMLDLLKAVHGQGVSLKGCPLAVARWPQLDIATAIDGDWDTEWLGLTLGVKLVASIDAAIEHIDAHSSGHSEAIITDDLAASQQFVDQVQSAAVYVNASTRFTDGAEFGLGAEVAVSTQKLHARGPMGLEALTSYKWIGYGDYLARS